MRIYIGNGEGISFAELLTLMLIWLKLTGKIEYSWMLVLSPIWISFIVMSLLTMGALLLKAFYGIGYDDEDDV